MTAERSDANVTGVIEACTGSAAATKELAAAIAALARSGDLILLVGDLGAGKTTFVQGFAAALEVGEPVTSPTFVLARTYEGRLTVNHLDVYRLDRLGEVADLALGELLDDDGVTLIEWGDVVRSELPADFLQIALTFGDGPDDRRVTLRHVGRSWAGRWSSLRTALERWAC